jgi:hypothetical protein
MKKLLPFLLLACLSFGATVLPVQEVQAQTSMISDNGLALDTFETADLTKTLTLTSQVSSVYKTVEFQFTATKISGTVGGTATLQGSLDGTLWYTVPGVTAYTITDATQTTAFKVTDYGSRYLRILVVGTGTMSASIKAKVVARK